MILVRPCRDNYICTHSVSSLLFQVWTSWVECVKYCKKNFELSIFLFEYSRIAFKLNILCGVLKVSVLGGIIGRLISKKKKKCL